MIDTALSEKIVYVEAKLDALENKMQNLTPFQHYLKLEERINIELNKNRIEMSKKEDLISRVSTEFDRIKENIQKMKDLKIKFTRFENTFGNKIALFSQDLDNLKTAFEMLKFSNNSVMTSEISFFFPIYVFSRRKRDIYSNKSLFP